MCSFIPSRKFLVNDVVKDVMPPTLNKDSFMSLMPWLFPSAKSSIRRKQASSPIGHVDEVEDLEIRHSPKFANIE